MDISCQVHVFDVVPTDTGMWAIIADGMGITVNAEKEDAVDIGRKLARANAPSRLVVRDEQGQIVTITPFAVSIRS